MTNAALQLSVEERKRELWRRGRLRWKLYPSQQSVYDAVSLFLDDPATRFEQFYLDISRQFGKTFMGVLLATERAIRNPGWRVLYTASFRSNLWQFVKPNMETLLSDCPDEYRPEWSSVENSYHFPNGSQIHMAGLNNGHEDDARGPATHLAINEEAAFVDRLDYVVSSIETPMLMTTGGRILHITTRPETAAHEVTKYRVACQVKGNYIKRTLDEATHVSAEARAKLIEELGGRDSSSARRECFCEDVTDEARAIVPEYNEAADVAMALPTEAPTWEQPTVACDVGFGDAHVLLYGYYDFRRAKRVIQAEDRLLRATTDKIADAVRTREAMLWGIVSRPPPDKETPDVKTSIARAEEIAEKVRRERAARGLPELRPPVRWSDVDLRLIADLEQLHGLAFLATDKDNLEAQVNALRITFRNRTWQIDPSCEHLRAELRLGVWNKQRTEFDRSKEHGHYDAVAAALYWNRNVDTHSNPYPALPASVTHYTHRIRDGVLNRGSETGRAFAQAFGKRRA